MFSLGCQLFYNAIIALLPPQWAPDISPEMSIVDPFQSDLKGLQISDAQTVRFFRENFQEDVVVQH